MLRRILAGCVALLVVATAAAQGFPAKPVRLVIGFPPGGPADFFGRVFAQGLSTNFGQSVIVETGPVREASPASIRWPRPRPTATRSR